MHPILFPIQYYHMLKVVEGRERERRKKRNHQSILNLYTIIRIYHRLKMRHNAQQQIPSTRIQTKRFFSFYLEIFLDYIHRIYEVPIRCVWYVHIKVTFSIDLLAQMCTPNILSNISNQNQNNNNDRVCT